MQLYLAYVSPNCRRPLAVAAHLGIDLEHVVVDFFKGEQKSPDYLAINPNGKIPTLVDGDLKLWESAAIMQYLADQKQANTLYPAELAARANVHRWMYWGLNHFGPAVGVFTWENFAKPTFGFGEPDQDRLANAKGDFATVAAILDAHLGENGPFVCGDEVTLADFGLAGAEHLWDRAQLPLDGHDNIIAWRARLNQVPAWQATAPEVPGG